MSESVPVEINLRGGIDTGTSVELVEPGSFLTVDNMVYDSSVGSLTKRNGFSKLTMTFGTAGSPAITSVKSVIDYASGLVSLNAGITGYESKYSFKYVSNIDRWLYTRNMQTTDIKHYYNGSSFVASGSTSGDIAYATYSGIGKIATVWVNNATAFIDIYDPTTKTKDLNGAYIRGVSGDCNSARVCAIGSVFVIIVTRPATNKIEIYTYDTALTTPAITSGGTIAGALTNGYCRAVTIGSSVYVVLANAGVIDRTFTVSSAGVISNNTVWPSGATENGFCVFALGTSPCVAYQLAADHKVYAQAFTTAWALSGSAVEVYASVSGNPTAMTGIDCGSSIINVLVSTTNKIVYTVKVNMVGGAKTEATYIYNCQLASHIFKSGSDRYVWVAYDVRTSQLQQIYALINVYGISSYAFYNTVATVYRDRAIQSVHAAGLSSVCDTSDYFCSAFRRVERQVTTGGSYAFGQSDLRSIAVDGVKLNYTPRNKAKFADQIFITGGVIQGYDGAIVQPLGFAVYPDYIVSGTPAGTGGSMSDGTYLYKVCYEYNDANGKLYRSAPSSALSVTVSGGGTAQSVTLVVPCNPFADSAQFGNMNVVAYRTANGGSVYYRTGAVSVNVLAQTVQVVDIESDANLTDNQILYTEGGYADNFYPAACAFMAARRDRVFAVQSDDLTAVWYSKPLAEGCGLEFYDGYYQRINQGGDITGIACIDDKVIVFKRNEIRYFYGDGPSSLGEGSFSPDIQVSANLGCSDSKSIVEFAGGIIFKSAIGWHLLDRSLQVTYIGLPIKTYDSNTVTSAVVHTDKTIIIFTLDTGTQFVVYDYRWNTWSTWSITPASGSPITIADACCSGGIYYFVDNGGIVWKETNSKHDENIPIQCKLVTPWFKFGGIMGYHRLSHFGILGTAGMNILGSPGVLLNQNLKISIARNFVDTDDETGTFTLYDKVNSLGLFRLRYHPAYHRSNAFRITIEEVDVSLNPLRLTGFTLMIQGKKGLHRMLYAQYVGG